MERPQLSSGVVALFVAIGLALLLPMVAASTAPGREGLIAFVSGRANRQGIAVVQCDGHGLRLLTHGRHDASPAWSPEGGWLAFERNGDLFVVRADGTGLRRLTRGPAFDTDPSWSPDGRRIAFVRDTALSVMRSNGRDVRVVWDDGVPLNSPSWSPDGKSIAFGWQDRDRMPGEIGITFASGGMEPWFPLPGVEEENDSFPDFAPDGARIAFIRMAAACEEPDCGQLPSLWVADPEGTWLRKISYWGDQPSWSPDGRRLAIDLDGDVVIVDLNGRERMLVSRNFADFGSQPAWQPLRQ